MDLTKSILEDVRESVGLSRETTDFDTDLIMHINSAIGKLNQNGVGKYLVVTDDTSTWNDLQDPTQIAGNMFFQTIPFFISMSTKLLFDPPPPSAAQYHSNNIDQTLWRLKIAYEEPYVTPVTTDV